MCMSKFYHFMETFGRVGRQVLLSVIAISLGTAFTVHAETAGQQPRRERIDISLSNATLEQVLLAVRNESGYYVLFNSAEAKQITGLNIDMNDAPVTSVLDAALRGTNFGYRVNDDTILIRRNAEQPGQPQIVNFHGAVYEVGSGEPIAGATVIIEGTGTGTTTDAFGHFTLNYDPGRGTTIVVSFLGMESVTRNISGTSFLRIELTPRTIDLEDVVVTGYANISAKNSAGNMTVIQGEELSKISSSSLIGALNAFEPSFRLKENLAAGSNPNVLPEFTLRGETAFNGEMNSELSRQSLLSNKNQPIFILDGFETTVDRIYDMDPQRVQKLTILKDASAAALYGSRAANGVIVVETKAPGSGKLNINYFTTVQLNSPALKYFDLMNAREKVEAEKAAGFYPDGMDDLYLNYSPYLEKLTEVNRGVDTDWLAQGVRNAVNHRHDITVNGGETNVRWSANLNYNSGNGVMKGSSRSTYSGEFKLDVTLGKFIISNVAYYGGQEGSESPFGSFSSYSHLQPYYKLRDERTGRYTMNFGEVGGYEDNPLFESAYLNSYSRSNYNRYSDQLQLRWDITPRFHVTGALKLEKQYSGSNKFIDPNSNVFSDSRDRTVATDPTKRGTLDVTTYERSETEGRLQFSYNNMFGKHSIIATANASIRQLKGTQLVSKYTGFASGAISSVNAAARIDGKPSNRNEMQRMATANIYVSYSYDQVYVIDLSGALDGNSEFGKNHKVAPFGSVAGAIRFHNYDFFKSEVIDRLVLRSSYGFLGRVPNLQSAAANIYENISQDDWYVTGIGMSLAGMGNPDLGWEQTRSFDVSGEIEMWKNRLYLKLAWYNKKTHGLLSTMGIPSSSGFTYYWGNMGNLRNRGVEIEFHAVPYRNADWDIIIGGKLSANRNVMTDLSDAAKAYNDLVDEFYREYDGANPHNNDNAGMKYGQIYKKYFEGGSTTSIPAVQSLGIDPGTGDELFRRPDGSVSYEWRPQDMIIAGNTEPTMSGSLNLSMRWKQFDLLAIFLMEFGGQAYNNTLLQYVENVDLLSTNADRRVNSMRWRQEGDVTPLRDIADMSLLTQPTTRFVQDNNVFRHTSLDVGYTFKPELIRKWGLSKVRLSLNTGELFMLSSIRLERGTDYPFERVYSFKAQVSF